MLRSALSAGWGLGRGAEVAWPARSRSSRPLRLTPRGWGFGGAFALSNKKLILNLLSQHFYGLVFFTSLSRVAVIQIVGNLPVKQEHSQATNNVLKDDELGLVSGK